MPLLHWVGWLDRSPCDDGLICRFTSIALHITSTLPQVAAKRHYRLARTRSAAFSPIMIDGALARHSRRTENAN